MFKKTVKIRNTAGIHCRPTSAILLEVQKFPGCRFMISANSGNSELNSMLSLLALGLACGDVVNISAEGANELEACNRIAELFEFEFDFPQQT